jgi:hypothetical protein
MDFAFEIDGEMIEIDMSGLEGLSIALESLEGLEDLNIQIEGLDAEMEAEIEQRVEEAMRRLEEGLAKASAERRGGN